MADYIPRTDGDLNIWVGNFQAKIATLGASVGLVAGDITDASDSCTAINSSINTAEMKKNTGNMMLRIGRGWVGSGKNSGNA